MFPIWLVPSLSSVSAPLPIFSPLPSVCLPVCLGTRVRQLINFPEAKGGRERGELINHLRIQSKLNKKNHDCAQESIDLASDTYRSPGFMPSEPQSCTTWPYLRNTETTLLSAALGLLCVSVSQRAVWKCPSRISDGNCQYERWGKKKSQTDLICLKF